LGIAKFDGFGRAPLTSAAARNLLLPRSGKQHCCGRSKFGVGLIQYFAFAPVPFLQKQSKSFYR